MIPSLADHVHHLPVAHLDDIFIVNLQEERHGRSATRKSRQGWRDMGCQHPAGDWRVGSLVFVDENLLWGGQHVCCCGCRGHHIVRGGKPHLASSPRPGGSCLTEFPGAVQISRAGCSSHSTLLQRSRNLVLLIASPVFWAIVSGHYSLSTPTPHTEVEKVLKELTNLLRHCREERILPHCFWEKVCTWTPRLLL